MGIDHGARRLVRGIAVIIAAVCVLAAMSADVGVAPATGPMSSVADMTSWLGTSGIRIPALSVGTNTVTLLWPTPVDSRGADSQVVRDYRIYENGRFLAQSSANTHTPAYGYMHEFATDPSHARAQPVAMHTYVVDALRPAATYLFSVQAVSSTGSVSSVGTDVTVRTKAFSKVLNVSDFGAVGDGKTLDTVAIQRSVDACSPGCTVLLPRGRTFVSGPLYLHGNMTLDVEGTLLRSAIVPGSSAVSRTASTIRTREAERSGEQEDRDAPLLSNVKRADHATDANIRIVGTGIIDGNGWRTEGLDQMRLPTYAKGNVSSVQNVGVLAAAEYRWAMDQRHMSSARAYAWRSNIASFQNVDGLYIGDGLTIDNPSQHVITVSHSSDVMVNRAVIDSYNANNGDGLDFTDGQDLTVVNSVFDTGDDAIALNAGYGVSGTRAGATRRVWVFDDYFGHDHSALAVGSGTAAGIGQVLAEDDVMVSGASALRCKSSAGTGGLVDDIVLRDSALADITEEQGEPFIVTSRYPSRRGTIDAGAPVFRDIVVERSAVLGSSGPAIAVSGLPTAWDWHLEFRRLTFVRTKPAVIDDLRDSVFDSITSDLQQRFFTVGHVSNVTVDGRRL